MKKIFAILIIFLAAGLLITCDLGGNWKGSLEVEQDGPKPPPPVSINLKTTFPDTVAAEVIVNATGTEASTAAGATMGPNWDSSAGEGALKLSVNAGWDISNYKQLRFEYKSTHALTLYLQDGDDVAWGNTTWGDGGYLVATDWEAVVLDLTSIKYAWGGSTGDPLDRTAVTQLGLQAAGTLAAPYSISIRNLQAVLK